jgi:hypothetical protein
MLISITELPQYQRFGFGTAQRVGDAVRTEYRSVAEIDCGWSKAHVECMLRDGVKVTHTGIAVFQITH